jgi:hypothetical protein
MAGQAQQVALRQEHFMVDAHPIPAGHQFEDGEVARLMCRPGCRCILFMIAAATEGFPFTSIHIRGRRAC